MRILVATGSFKESLNASTVASAVVRGLSRVWPQANIIERPFFDGGEGFTRGMVETLCGKLVSCRVTGPVGKPVESHFGILDDGQTAILEMAAAAGLRLVPRDRRDPLLTTTYGVGELIRDALDYGRCRLLIGCGDSGTSDGGVGMAQALGARFLDRDGRELSRGGGELVKLAAIDLSGLDPRLSEVEVTAACNMATVLCGPQGTARVFGPQKGADPRRVAILEAGLACYAEVVERELGLALGDVPGSGASGGLGAGLVAFLGAELVSSVALVGSILAIEDEMARADLVVTGEGRMDAQTLMDKVPYYVAQLGLSLGVPVAAIAGSLGPDASILYEYGIMAMTGIIPHPCTLEDAFSNAEKWTTEAAERLGRAVLLGQKVGSRSPDSQSELAYIYNN